MTKTVSNKNNFIENCVVMVKTQAHLTKLLGEFRWY